MHSEEMYYMSQRALSTLDWLKAAATEMQLQWIYSRERCIKLQFSLFDKDFVCLLDIVHRHLKALFK